MKNRIKNLREERGWSMRELADRLNSSASTINNLEKGNVRLNTDWIERLAKIFNVSHDDIFDFEERQTSLVVDDVVLYSNDDQPIKLGPSEVIYEVKTVALDQIGILPGILLVVDTTPEHVASLQSEDVVIAQLYNGKVPITLIRQYIAPSLLITNSSERNAPTINLRTHDAGIKGIVTAAHRQMRREKSTR
jgi:transcriptional regulator with XRE-family HTH domain